MLKLKFIGRGSCFNTAEGNNSAYIKEGNTLVLFDCGSTVFDRIKQSDLMSNIYKVNIFITHLHDDHVGSLGGFILYCFYGLGITPNIYFKDRDLLVNFLAYQGAIEGVTYEYLRDTYLEDLHIKVTAVETTHYEYYKPVEGYYANKDAVAEMKNYFKCYGYYLVRHNDNQTSDSTYFSGDSNYIPQPVLSGIFAIKRALLYHDVCLPDYEGNGHLSLKRLCKLVPPEFRSQVYCMHLDSDELIAKCKEEGFNVVEVEV